MIHVIPESELILNADGSVYHLNLLPSDLADDIIIVGDPDRVEKVSAHFDRIEMKKEKRAAFCSLKTNFFRVDRTEILSLKTKDTLNYKNMWCIKEKHD